MHDRTPLHRAMIAAGLQLVGPVDVARIEKALADMGFAIVQRPALPPIIAIGVDEDWPERLGATLAREAAKDPD